MSKKTVVLLGGHGGADFGASYGSIREKDINLEICLLVEEILSGYECNVLLVRRTDVFIPLAAKAKFCNDNNSALNVDIHANAGGGTGTETFIYSGLTLDGRTGKIARIIHNKVAEVFLHWGSRDRGLKQAAFYILKNTNAPAVLPELGFIDDRTGVDIKLLKNAHFKLAVAAALTDGIVDALSLKAKPKPQPKPPLPEPNSLPKPIRFVPVNIYVNGEDTDVVLQGIFSDDMVTRIPVLDVKGMPAFTSLQVEPHGTHIDMKFTVPKKDLTYAIKVLRGIVGLE